MIFSEPILVALIALAGAFVGSVLQAAFARRQDQSRFVRDQRRASYQRFLITLGDLAQYPKGSSDHDRALSAVVDARCQIALFGSAEVANILRNIFENDSSFTNEVDQKRLCEAIGLMRRDSIGRAHRLDNEALYSLIFADGDGKPL